ncbi:MAG: TVP38/TMEM64 family protein [Alphaproteobacteria bacterium]|nr:TVP38/TMEM64 family protein [Alphaproteobacteria bacterium]
MKLDSIIHFFTNMDARAVRAVSISLGLFALVAVMFILGRSGLVDSATINAWLAATARHWYYALPAAILAFTALAYIGAPQFALMAACVLAFGPWAGSGYAWVATLVSATATFYTGRAAGAEVVRRYGGRTVNRISEFVGRNGFWASMIIRNVPSAPFIVVNMAAGVSRMTFLAFIAGTGIGIIPKIALVAFAGRGVLELVGGGSLWLAASALLAAGGWLGAMLIARRWLSGPETGEAADREAGDVLAKTPGPSHKE